MGQRLTSYWFHISVVIYAWRKDVPYTFQYAHIHASLYPSHPRALIKYLKKKKIISKVNAISRLHILYAELQFSLLYLWRGSKRFRNICVCNWKADAFNLHPLVNSIRFKYAVAINFVKMRLLQPLYIIHKINHQLKLSSSTDSKVTTTQCVV